VTCSDRNVTPAGRYLPSFGDERSSESPYNNGIEPTR